MPTLSDLLSDPGASIELIAGGSYLDDNGSSATVFFSRTGWADPPTGEYGSFIPPLLDISLRVSQSIDVLEPKTLLEGPYSEIRLVNNSIHFEYIGYFDNWYLYSIDQQPWYIYLVGVLSTGERVELSDVVSTPLYTLTGIDIPEVSSSECTIRTRSQSEVLGTALQPVTFSPPCLLFPGTSAGVVDLGDNLDITGVQSLSFWVYLTDPVSTTQYLVWKDGTTTGYYLAVGLVGAGAIVAGVEIVVRGQSPATTTTAANVLRAYQWHRIDVSIDTTTRRIDIDGTTAVTTTSITGTPTGNSVSLVIGKSLLGRIHRALWWSNARSNATMSAEGRTPITGAESNLREAFLFGEGSGLTTVSVKSGSVLTGTIHSSVLWDTATWNYQAILGQHEPYVLGTVSRVPVSWIDPPKQIGQISRGAIALLSELQSNHGTISSANYTVDLTNGTFKVTSGALSGTYSATISANNIWNAALLFGSTSSAIATITSPTGSRSIGVQFRADFTDVSFKSLIGWDVAGAAAGRFIIRFNQSALPSEPNRIQAYAINDAAVNFQVSPTTGLIQGRTYTAIASLNTSGSVVNGQDANSLWLYLDGTLVGSTAISGNWTTALTSFGVGVRAFDSTRSWIGRLDEPFVFNRVISATEAKTFTSKPLTGSESGLVFGWHLDSVATPFAGATSLTLANTTFTAGRSAPTDLARSVLFSYGYTESDLDFDSWFDSLIKNKSDCGWFVTGGQNGIDVLNIILGGLGFVLYELYGIFYLKRFEGLSGTATTTFNPSVDSISDEISAQPDPAVYQWIIEYNTNNTKLDPANINGALASTDPDRYGYGSKDTLSVTKTDGETLIRFPGALTKIRRTALLNLRDAETEALRLLPMHKHGADKKSVSMFLLASSVGIMEEIGPLQAETNIDTGTFIVIGIDIDEESGRLIVWRPAI